MFGAIALLGTVAHAQTVKKSTLSGVLTSASATAPAAGTPQTVLTTPASGFFILTQACATTPGVGQTTFTAGTLGRANLPHLRSEGLWEQRAVRILGMSRPDQRPVTDSRVPFYGS
jgi:hypothetical protein